MAGRRKKKKNRFEFLTKKFPIRMQRKLVMLFMAVILAFVVLVGRITWINISKGSRYTRIVLDQQNYNSRVIAYKRGDIVDRNGSMYMAMQCAELRRFRYGIRSHVRRSRNGQAAR